MTDQTSSLGFVLNDVARLLSKRFGQLAGHLGLTRSQWRAVDYVSKNEGMNQAYLPVSARLDTLRELRKPGPGNEAPPASEAKPVAAVVSLPSARR
jgi:hypothetical protein